VDCNLEEALKNCVRVGIEKLLSKVSQQKECMGRLLDLLGKLQPLSLPYRTRGARIRGALSKRIISINECGISAIAFRVRGIREFLIVCIAPKIELILMQESLYSDELSGLKMRLRKPVLIIGDCRIPFEWRRTSMVLEPGKLEKCGYCEKIYC
jgi:hypothetical protein